jgi:hypothetical protein
MRSRSLFGSYDSDFSLTKLESRRSLTSLSLAGVAVSSVHVDVDDPLPPPEPPPPPVDPPIPWPPLPPSGPIGPG